MPPPSPDASVPCPAGEERVPARASRALLTASRRDLRPRSSPASCAHQTTKPSPASNVRTSTNSGEGPLPARRSSAAWIRSLARLVQRREHVDLLADRHRRPAGLAACPQMLDRLLPGSDRLSTADWCDSGPSPSRRGVAVARAPLRSRELEGARVVQLGGVDVERQGATSGQRQGVDRRLQERFGELRLTRHLGEVQGGDVVEGEDLGELLDAGAGLASSQAAALACFLARAPRGSSP